MQLHRRLVVAALLLIASAGGAAAQSSSVGVGSHHLDASSVQLLRDLGVRHVRHTLYWALWTQDPAYRKGFASGLDRAVRAGLEPLVVVHQDPAGFASRTEMYRAFARFLEDRAREFPEVRAWQLWNEMDVGTFTDGFGGRQGLPIRERGRLYGEMLKLAYPAVKRGSPRALVVTGGVASGIGEGFLDGLYDTGAPFDVLAIHTYGFPVELPFADRGREARALMRRRGDSRPLWNTEFGMELAVVPPGWDRSRRAVDRYHLESWRDPIELNAREGIYDRVYGHVLRQDGDLSFDLVRRDGSLRPAATWLRERLR